MHKSTYKFYSICKLWETANQYVGELAERSGTPKMSNNYELGQETTRCLEW